MKNLEISRFPELDYLCNEALNTLCTNLFYCGSQNKTILITSRYAMEGKSLVAMNLMRTLSSLQKRVVLLDTDLRRSDIVGRFRLKFPDGYSTGLAQYLAGMCDISDILYSTNLPNAHIIPIGREVAISLQLLNSPRMPALMQHLRENFDIVLVDTSPVGMIVDALDVAKHCDGAILVVSYKRGKRREIAEVTQMINRTGCKILGSVLNNVNLRSLSNRKYYYSSERYTAKYYNQYRVNVPRKGIFGRKK